MEAAKQLRTTFSNKGVTCVAVTFPGSQAELDDTHRHQDYSIITCSLYSYRREALNVLCLW